MLFILFIYLFLFFFKKLRLYKLLSVLFFLGTLGCQVVVVVVFFFFFFFFGYVSLNNFLLYVFLFLFMYCLLLPFFFFFFSKSWDMVPGDSLCGKSRANYYSDCAPT